MTSNLYSSDYLYSRAEVSRHDKRADAWIILHGEVYNVTRWLDRHPGGGKLLVHYAGEDATVSWLCMVLDWLLAAISLACF